jgi:hypothetical protein
MDYLLDIAEAAYCSASDLMSSGAGGVLDAICSGWAKQPADELLLRFLGEVLDGLFGRGGSSCAGTGGGGRRSRA